MREDLLDVSPSVGITPEAETSRDRLLSDDEIRAVWKAFETEGYPYGPLFKLMLVTAQRRGEVAGIRRCEIEGDAWRLPGARTKGGAGHLVPLSSLALEIICSLPYIGDHLFTSGRRLDADGKNSDKPVIAFRKAKARCDLMSRVENWRLHDLRRTAATNMRRLGTDRLTVSKVLNHAESGITQVYDRYGADAEKRDALELWCQRVRYIVEERN